MRAGAQWQEQIPIASRKYNVLSLTSKKHIHLYWMFLISANKKNKHPAARVLIRSLSFSNKYPVSKCSDCLEGGAWPWVPTWCEVTQQMVWLGFFPSVFVFNIVTSHIFGTLLKTNVVKLHGRHCLHASSTWMKQASMVHLI